MIRSQSVNRALLSMGLDVVLTMLALFLARQIRIDWPALFPTELHQVRMPIWYYAAVLIIWGLTFLFASVYDPSHNLRAVDEFQSVLLGILFAAIMYAGFFFLVDIDASRGLYLTFVLLDILFLLGWRVGARRFFKTRPWEPQRRILIVGAGEVGRRVCETFKQTDPSQFMPVGYLDDNPDKSVDDLPIFGRTCDARRVVEEQQATDVVVALPLRAHERVSELARDLSDTAVRVHVVPDYFSMALYRTQVENFGGLPMINLRDPALNDVQRLIKRIFDVVIVSILILICSPAMLVVALAIKLDTRGPIFFRQRRVGENRKPFYMLKFRSMVVDAEKMQHEVSQVNELGQLIHKTSNDPRVTRVGRVIRRGSLDELPQFFNIWKGEMSLVGPRPELPYLVETYEPWQLARFVVPQGLTGWWQVNGRSDKPMHLHTEEDLYYIRHYSLWLDLYILLRTPFVVLRGKGAF